MGNGGHSIQLGIIKSKPGKEWLAGSHVEASRVKETSNQRRKIWEEEKFPHMWKTAVIVPSFKKKDKLVCDNYRGIKG